MISTVLYPILTLLSTDLQAPQSTQVLAANTVGTPSDSILRPILDTARDYSNQRARERREDRRDERRAEQRRERRSDERDFRRDDRHQQRHHFRDRH